VDSSQEKPTSSGCVHLATLDVVNSIARGVVTVTSAF